jgi:hypothetical protein
VGIGYTPLLREQSLVDGVEPVGTAAAKEMTRRQAREAGRVRDGAGYLFGRID